MRIANYVCLLIYITICLIVSAIIFSFYLYTKYYTCEVFYIHTIQLTMAMFIPIVMMAAIQGILISSSFSKRIYAIAVAIGFFLVLKVELSYFFSLYLNPMTVN